MVARMVGQPMTTQIALSASPSSILRGFSGRLAGARRAYPDVLHLEIEDSRGRIWQFTTWDSSWPDPLLELVGEPLQRAQIDKQNGVLRLYLGKGEGRDYGIVAEHPEHPDDPPNWELLTPDGLSLVFGPGFRWQVSRADEPPPTDGSSELAASPAR